MTEEQTVFAEVFESDELIVEAFRNLPLALQASVIRSAASIRIEDGMVYAIEPRERQIAINEIQISALRRIASYRRAFQ